MVRYAEVRRNRHNNNLDPAHLSPQQQYDELSAGIKTLVHDQYQCLNNEVLPELAANGLKIIDRSDWTDDDRLQLRGAVSA